MGGPAKRRATYGDLLAVPANRIAQIVQGVLVTLPRARLAQRASGLGPRRRALRPLPRFVEEDPAAGATAGVRAEPFEAFEPELGVLWAR